MNSTAPLTISENQPVGTFVGQFTAHDLHANASLSYRLANGADSQHNNRFSLDANGTFVRPVSTDENQPFSKSACRLTNNASIQEAFTVSVIDLVESNATNPDATTQPGTPAVSSNPSWKHGKRKVEKDSVTLRGSLLDNGGTRITERGFALRQAQSETGPQKRTRLDANGSKNFKSKPPT